MEDRRLDQVGLDEVAERVVDELAPRVVRARVDAALVQEPAQLGLVARPEPALFELLDELDALPRRGEVDLVPAERDLRRPDRLARDGLDELLDPPHRVLVVRVGLVPLDHRELGRVLVRHALVTEVPAQLVDALEPADDQPLEVELGRDPQVEVLVELVRARDERVGERAAVARLEDRRLDLDEAVAVEVRGGSKRPCARAPRSRGASPRSSAGRGSAGGSGSGSRSPRGTCRAEAGGSWRAARAR